MKTFIIALAFSSALMVQGSGSDTSGIVKERYLYILPGYAYQEGRDVGMSPLLYVGNNFSGVLGVEVRKAKFINRIEASTLVGGMYAPALSKELRSSVKAYRVQLDYAYLHLVKEWKQDALRLYAGGIWNTLANARYHTGYVNNAWNYDFSTSLGGSVAIFYNFKWKKKHLIFHTGIELPLVGFNIRPAYASSIPEGFIACEGEKVKAFFKSGQVQTFNRFFRLRANSMLEYILFNGNRLLLGYTWDYYSMQKNHKVQMASHQILVGWSFSF